MGYAFNPFTGKFDNTGSGGSVDIGTNLASATGDKMLITDSSGNIQEEAKPYTILYYNSSGSQSGNRYNSFADLYSAIQASPQPVKVVCDGPAGTYSGFFNDIIPSGTYNFDDVTFVGNGILATGGGILVALMDGVTISSWKVGGNQIEYGFGLTTLSTASVMSISSGQFTFRAQTGCLLASVAAFGAAPFFSQTGGTLTIDLKDGSSVLAGSIGVGGTVITKTTGKTIMLVGGSNCQVDNNTVAGTGSTDSSNDLEIVASEPGAFGVNGVTFSGYTGTVRRKWLGKAEHINFVDPDNPSATTQVQEYLEELDTRIDQFNSNFLVPTVKGNVMWLDYAGNSGTDDGAWSTSDLGNLTAGVDLRARVWFDFPSDVTPPSTDKYQEVLSQEHPTAGGGDTFEAAIYWGSDGDSGEIVQGQPHTFWEAAKTSVGTDIETNAGWDRAGLKARQWADLRWTQDFGTNTVTYWRSVPYEISADCEQVDGVWYYPLRSVVDTDFSGIDTAATSAWWIGKRYTGYIASMKMTDYANSTTYFDITEADLDAETIGTTSFTDSQGVTWATTNASIVAAPAYITDTSDTYSLSNVTTDRTIDADSTTLDEVADVLGTLIQDLRDRGIIG